MRTTVTIDPDTAALLQEEVARTGLSFKEVLNRAVRRALAPRAERINVEPLFQEPFPPGLPSFNRLADEWDDEETMRELRS
ncbi:MAG: ribbon-helix-helix protein, CopG family [Armatimonadetes bacterium]|nr:ribbon-helix-helix protein, CopG family [Armatimonadota bacterium]